MSVWGISRASQSHLAFPELCGEKGACGGRNEHRRRLKEEPSEAWHSTAKPGFNDEHLKGGYDKAELLHHTHPQLGMRCECGLPGSLWGSQCKQNLTQLYQRKKSQTGQNKQLTQLQSLIK